MPVHWEISYIIFACAQSDIRIWQAWRRETVRLGPWQASCLAKHRTSHAACSLAQQLALLSVELGLGQDPLLLQLQKLCQFVSDR